MIIPGSYTHGHAWNLLEEDPLWLLTIDELDSLPSDTVVLSIAGGVHVVSDIIDRDTRFGYTAYGLRESQFLAPEGYDTAEVSTAKDHVYDEVDRELNRQGIDPYSERADQPSPDLIDLADAIVERLLKEGAVFPETIRELHR